MIPSTLLSRAGACLLATQDTVQDLGKLRLSPEQLVSSLHVCALCPPVVPGPSRSSCPTRLPQPCVHRTH